MEQTKFNRILTFLLSITLLLSQVSFTALAETNDRINTLDSESMPGISNVGRPPFDASDVHRVHITAFDGLDAAVAQQQVAAGTARSGLNLPERLLADGYIMETDNSLDSGASFDSHPLTIEGVTWEIDPDHGNSPYDPWGGSYAFTPVLPGGYAATDGVHLPEIRVVVGGINRLLRSGVPVDYLDENNVQQTCLNATPVTSSDTAWTDGGWYVVNSDVTISTRVAASGAVHLILADGFTLTAQKGINVSEGNSLTIYAQSVGDTAGALTANGGGGEAGIGGGDGGAGGTITIRGGTITATGDDGNGNSTGAGIGGGGRGAGGIITINGGTVTATGGVYGMGGAAGIGGGDGGAGGTITIRGGDITATGGGMAAGIGGSYNGSGGTITIRGGTVHAKGGSHGAGIGSAMRDGGIISISSGDITAEGGSYAAGIGGGNGAGGSITISGGTIAAKGGNSGAGIGGGKEAAGGEITISGGTIAAKGGNSGAGIGGGKEAAGGEITISGGTIAAKGSNSGAGIGGGTGGDGGKITISGGDITAEGVTGAGIGGGIGGNSGEITIDDGTVNATGSFGAGIGGGEYGALNTITINGGTVNATGRFGAGIGSGHEFESGGIITINGGTVHAASNLVGIGGAIDAIVIGGGIVTATGDDSAGIGGAYGSTVNTAITISGGMVTATGGEGGVGIGIVAGGGVSGGHSGSFTTTRQDGTAGNAFIVASSIRDRSGVNSWSGVIVEGATGAVYGNSITLAADAELPAQTALRIAQGQTLTVGEGITFANKGALTIDTGATLINRGTINNVGIINNYGVITGNAPNGDPMESSTVAVAFKNQSGSSSVTYGDTLTITATAQKRAQNATRSASVGMVDFWLNEIGGSGTKLNDSPIPVVQGAGNTVTATFVLVLTGTHWNPGNYVICADFGGYESAKLLESTGRATLTVRAGGDSGGGTQGSGILSSPVGKQPNQPANVQTKVNGKVDQDGNISVKVSDKAITDAIKTATKQAGTGGIAVTIQATGTEKADNIVVRLSSKSMQALVAAGAKFLTIECAPLTVTLDLASINTLFKAGGEVKLTAAKQDNATLSTEAKNAIGSRPVYRLTATAGNKSVSRFGGQISIAIPYTPAAGETFGNLYGVYVNEAGKVTWLTNSAYDSNMRTLRFATNHFSAFGIGYKPTTTWTDTANHRAKDDIAFATARELMGSTGATTFSPDATVTRGVFATALGRLAQVDVNRYKSGRFTDVPANAYYAPYANWAAEQGILSGINGIAATSFSPNQAVTRQEMAVWMKNYAKATGYAMPKTRAAVTFADHTAIASWANNAVKITQMAGVVMGKNGNRFDPVGTATRAEVCAVLRRYVELVLDPATADGVDVNDSGSIVLYEKGKPVKSARRKVGRDTYQFNANGEAAFPAVNSKKITGDTTKKG